MGRAGKVCVCGGADMMEEEEGGHHLGVRAWAGAQISALYSITLYKHHII